jgi:hypothetical protein
LLYFARVTNHYLHLVKACTSGYPSSRHAMKYPIIVDSGANYHMFKEKEFFESGYYEEKGSQYNTCALISSIC